MTDEELSILLADIEFAIWMRRARDLRNGCLMFVLLPLIIAGALWLVGILK